MLLNNIFHVWVNDNEFTVDLPTDIVSMGKMHITYVANDVFTSTFPLEWKNCCAVFLRLSTWSRKGACMKLQPLYGQFQPLCGVFHSLWGMLKAPCRLLQPLCGLLTPTCDLHSLYVDCHSHCAGFSSSMWAIAASAWEVIATTWVGTASVWDVAVSMWFIEVSAWDAHPLCGILQSPFGLRMLCADFCSLCEVYHSFYVGCCSH